jgi:hypothetical protein
VPTARELIEQADALMRRNRPPVEPPPGVVQPPPVPLPEATTSAAVELPSSPPSDALAVPGPAALPAAEPADDFPVLTEALEEVGEVADTLADDVPVLSDAIEEIEAPVLREPLVVVEESEWRLDDRGDLVVSAGMASPAAAPPAVPLHAPTAEPPEDVVRLVQRWDAQLGLAPAPVSTEESDEGADEVDRALGLGEAAFRPDVRAIVGRDETLDHSVADVAPVIIEGPLASEAAEIVVPPVVIGVPEGADVAGRSPAAEPAREHPAGPAALPDAQWDALAEEIRMQVLQRIDIFTDTGLRAQLGARLQPVVDRASADLVATINQHVGDLLRAYVAEAIEREIEKWRSDSAGKAP